MTDRVEVTADDQRRWEGIVRDWDVGSSTVLTQINEKLRELHPEEWAEPYKGFVYGFRGMLSGQDTFGVCGQWVAYRTADELSLYTSVPGTAGGVYQRGGAFDVSCLFSREKLDDPAGFAQLWTSVRASRGRLIQLMDHWDILGLCQGNEIQEGA